MPCESASGLGNAGGSDFSLSNLGDDPAHRDLRADAVKPPFIEILENPAKVKAQLRELYDSGQRRISNVLWHAPLTGRNINKSRTGYLVNSASLPSPRIFAGLEAYYTAVRDTGFTEVVFRAGLQGCARPSTWVEGNTLRCPTRYSQTLEDRNFEILVQAHEILDRVFAGTNVRRWYDLAVEGIGWPEPHPTYNEKLWKRYIARFGSADSYGFSIAYAPGRLREALRTYDRAGRRPPLIAVDIYDGHSGQDIATMLADFAGEMRSLGAARMPVIIQETYYNHAPSYAAMSEAVYSGALSIAAVYQWPLDTRDVWHATPARYEAYCPELARLDRTASRDTQSLPR